MNGRRSLTVTSFALLALVLALAGCGRVAPTSPDAGLDPPPSATHASGTAAAVGVTPEAPGGSANGSGVVTGPVLVILNPVSRLLGSTLDLVRNVVKLVLPGLETNVRTSRWSLQFHPGSLSQSTLIRITQSSDGTLRAQCGPDGTQFGVPVDATISYAGTSLDPSSPSYVRGTVPVFLWLDPATGKWVEMPSTFDPETRTVHAQLHHFSTYGVGGRAGW